ncbi:MAG: 1-deoxy-D-xylulose-5-phosphate synthase [bacterium]
MRNGKNSKYKYLLDINSPTDLKKLNPKELPIVCEELRDYIIDTISKTGGHFGAGLGVVELTVALHYIYDTPKDRIIFDVGHQGYPHKVLTGRRELLHTIRQKGGLSGFLKTSESEYDAFGAGHASTSISAALGMASARDILGKKNRVVAVIGDGALTGGMAYEAMNNCGVQKRDITVILNDNNMSINHNVSAISNYFNELFASPVVEKVRSNIWELTGRMDELGDRIRKVMSRVEGGVKAVITPGSLFEAFGFRYFGPINGNNVLQLVRILRLIRDIHGPILLHIVTQKGKGYKPAEDDSSNLHAIGKIDVNTGKSIAPDTGKVLPPQYYRVFGQTLVELCDNNPKIVGITAAMGEGTGLDLLEQKYPNRFFDVGIAEQHAVTFATGLAKEGVIPVVAIYSTFLQRAYDQIIHDCALQNLHVIFTLDRAGIVGEDGPTHHGILDMSYLRSIPKMVVVAPKDEQELRDLMFSSVYFYNKGPVAIRYPRGRGEGVPLTKMKYIPLGQSEIIRKGKDIAIIAVGKMVNQSLKAAENLAKEDISVEVVNARFVKPLDTEMLDDIVSRFNKIITVEDGQKQGGFGSAVLEYLAEKDKIKNDIYIHGIPDNFVEHGTQAELLHELKLDANGIALVVKEHLGIKLVIKKEELISN